ncbi:hypothetical protein [Petroclostridium sp. X23]|uniref:hypothetical protein n=1 Tax=Petroclostridium sp. X23 TaxID=3045146 RepID=UPI0024AE6C46|nr:hypothetical protein [Petroclostridium sp. X23]WHH57756.1 hypothetical protein QKW49_18300 [Petroclostridium sp. X23]
MRKVRFGVLGYARIAEREVIPAMMKSESAEFHAVAIKKSRKEKFLYGEVLL